MKTPSQGTLSWFNAESGDILGIRRGVASYSFYLVRKKTRGDNESYPMVYHISEFYPGVGPEERVDIVFDTEEGSFLGYKPSDCSPVYTRIIRKRERVNDFM